MRTTDVFIQVKIDYVQYMMQIYKLMAYDETTTGILFALMLENYLTVDNLEILTGFSKPTIKKTLSRISNIYSDFPILQTKKPHDRKKYYYCPITFDIYVKQSFLSVMTASELSLEFIPELLSRLDALSPQSPSILHIRRVFVYLYTAIYYYKEVFGKSEDLLEQMLKNPDDLPEFSTIVKEIQFTPRHHVDVPEVDSLLSIKRDFISNMLELSTELIGGENELISVFLALFLENEPITQDDLMTVTDSSRTKVSQALTMMEELNVIQIVKKAGDRKKYYKGASSMEEYGKGKLGRVQGYYAQIQMMMQTKFLPDLEKIGALEEEEKQEKERLQKFFQDNIYYYSIFIRFSTAMHQSIGDELQKVANAVK